MVLSYKNECSRVFTVARVFALISIVSAHIKFHDSNHYALSKAYSCMASLGVIAFLFMSSYYYNSEKFGSLIKMLKNKTVSIGLPWVFFGSLTYAYNAILSNNLSLFAYLKWMIGYKTYLYYLTVLIICFIVFYKTNRVVCFYAIIINIVSLMLTAAGVMDPVIKWLHITDYLNIFNWIGIFGAGQLLREVEPEKIYKFFIRTRWICVLLFIIFTGLIFAFDIKTGYFSFVGIWYEIIGMLFIFGISTVRIFSNKLFEYVANDSFAVYLIHMVLIGMFDFVYNLTFVTQLFSNILIIAISVIGLEIGRFIIKVIKLERILNPLFGFRTRKITK